MQHLAVDDHYAQDIGGNASVFLSFLFCFMLCFNIRCVTSSLARNLIATLINIIMVEILVKLKFND
jgi:hypothetical protein